MTKLSLPEKYRGLRIRIKEEGTTLEEPGPTEIL